MQYQKITLIYRKIIDSTATKNWDKQVWNDSHLEYRMKAQFYDQNVEFPVFKDLVTAKPEAEKLHYLVSLSALGHLQWLNNIFPDIANTLGKRCVPFQNFSFKILASHFDDKNKHQIQIDFHSEPLYFINTIGNMLWLGIIDNQSEEIETFQLNLQPNLMINKIVK